MHPELDIKKDCKGKTGIKYTNKILDDFINNNDNDSDIEFDISELKTIKIKKSKIKKSKINEDKNKNDKNDKNKKNKTKTKFVFDPDNTTPEYIGKLLKMRTDTIGKMEKLCSTTNEDKLLSTMSPFKDDREASYYLITRQIINYSCSECEIKPVYNNKPLILVLDHIDNLNSNYDEDNLRFLCPNCLTQIKGENHMKNYSRKTAKTSCIICHKEFAANRIKGDKCNSCMFALCNEQLYSNNYQFKHYEAPKFTLKTLDKTDDFKEMGAVADYMSNVDKSNYISCKQMIENEEHKSKAVYNMKIKEYNKKKNKYMDVSKEINTSESVISQIIRNRNKVKDEINVEEKMTKGMTFD